MSSLRATLIGFSAILMWSLLAVLTVASGQVPPFQLAALTFAIGGAIGMAWVARAGAWSALRQRPQAWALGVCGLFDGAPSQTRALDPRMVPDMSDMPGMDH